jgi:hypothetical protein
MRKRRLSKEYITELVDKQQDLKFFERRVDLYNEHIGRQRLQQKQQLEQVIDNLKSRIDNYDGIASL